MDSNCDDTVGEWVGSGGDLDYWCDSVQNRAGTFDFGLRGALYGIVTGGGTFDLATVPGSQQGNRARTVTFVNNHDTFRPVLDAAGNYVGWDSNNELAAHIDPYDPRLSAVYALAFAVDGSPTVFIEDLYDMGRSGNRYSHDPQDKSQLPVRSDIANIVWCHQQLRFKEGAYKVRHGSADLLVIERSGKAVVAVTDSWTGSNSASVATDFPAGTVLKDYSGAFAGTQTVGAGGTVDIPAASCDGTALNGRRCYSIWAPESVAGYSLTPRPTTQEWEMADDLGDSHPLSLQQGGQLPAGSVETRTAGRIFVQAASSVTYKVYLSTSLHAATVEFYDQGGAVVHAAGDQLNFNGTFVADATGWLTVKARNSDATSPGQVVWLVVTYLPPATLRTAAYDTRSPSGHDWQLYHRVLSQRSNV